MLTQERLREVLDYCPDDGVFRWRKAVSIRIRGRIGRPAGCLDRHGYPLIRIDGKRRSAHRLAWFWVHGEWPEGELDHINGDPADYRIANLRPATRSQNLMNTKAPAHNTSGVKGVTWDRANGKWIAQIQKEGRYQKLGRFSDKVDAIRARAEAETRLHGEFARAV